MTSTRRDGGFLAAVLGVLAAVTMPVAILATRYSDSYDLLHAAFAIPIAIGIGLLAILRARPRGGSLLGANVRTRAQAIGWALGITGIALASSALISVVVYGVLTYLGEH